MKNDTVIFGDLLGIGEEVTVYGSSTFLPCSFSLKKNGFTVETYEAEQVEFQGIDVFKCSMRIPADTGFYVISLYNDEDTSSRTLRVIDRIHTDSVRTEKLVEEMVFALPPDEFRRIRSRNIEAKMSFLIDFWNGHDPTPSTERNEVMETYYRRIEYADERFVEGGKGWKTDRGKIYVLLGLPDEIEDYSFALESRPFQIWYYYSRGMKFTFVDEHLIGNYKLTEPRGWLDVWRSYFDYN
ncbi:GWxTD domain-containing protein [candidate division WOR-3 bacterium]|nr:GWxTD domain-containing protein [candidate division WOR-3 bacterium]